MSGCARKMSGCAPIWILSPSWQMWTSMTVRSRRRTVMSVLDKAKKYYPTLWPIERLRTLVEAGKLTPAEYREITGEEYAK